MKKAIAIAIVVILGIGWAISLAGVNIGGINIAKAKDQVKLGLDLKGGMYVVLEAKTDATGEDLKKLMQQTQSVVERRVNSMGLAEPVVTIEGENRIRVELPGAKDAEAALAAIGKTAQLEFIDAWGNVVVTGDQVKDATSGINTEKGNEFVINLKLDKEGSEAFHQATKKALAAKGTTVASQAFGNIPGEVIMIVLDGEVITAPGVQSEIPNGQAVISGNYTAETAATTAALIRGGALPATLEKIEMQTVGPSLGLDATNSSVLAGIIGITLIMIFMVLVYRVMGLAADIALGMYILLYLWVIIGFGAVLTLPGIAGMILSVGMAVDANVIIFARIKEEIKLGKSIRVSLQSGFQKALSTIVDANITTVIAGVVLYQFGSGPVKGFAVTLLIGIVVSMFTALIITRALMSGMHDMGMLSKEKYFGIKSVKEGM